MKKKASKSFIPRAALVLLLMPTATATFRMF